MVGILVKHHYYIMGDIPFFKSFFSTVAVNLEGEKWGSEFPSIMRDLYAGELQVIKAEQALDEINRIENAFEVLPLSCLVWDLDNVKLLPPENRFSSSMNCLLDFFVTKSGDSLFKLLRSAIEKGMELKHDLIIETH